jgi:predicted transcriptional regulator
MERSRSLGEQELDVLRYITDLGDASVGEVARGYGEPRGLARTTLLTVMERLRTKGYLTRVKREGTYRYSPRLPSTDLMRGVIREFIERSLGGSVSPFVAYLAETKSLSPSEVEDLRRLLDTMEAVEKDVEKASGEGPQ